ncbi:hypothetical protein [Roseateles paludis]|jgi:prepilin-type processing-associated H-X9-DG protein|uniref:Secreted protein with PEP-CTERM sorting signal n=1 Tax=Roseateles paludis TaxID=3145238 RepID=A0ABV0FVE1_9BURK
MHKLLKAMTIGLVGLLAAVQSAQADISEFNFWGVVTTVGTSSLGSANASKSYAIGEVVTGRLVYDPLVPRLEHPFIDTAFYTDYSPSSGLELTSKAGVVSSLHKDYSYINLVVDHHTGTPFSPDGFYVNQYGPFHADGMKDSPYIYDLNLGLEYIDPVSSLALPATLSPSLFAGGQFNVAFADGSYASVTLNFKDAIPAVPEPQQAWMLLLGLIGIYGVVKASGTSGRHSEEGLAR